MGLAVDPGGSPCAVFDQFLPLEADLDVPVGEEIL